MYLAMGMVTGVRHVLLPPQLNLWEKKKSGFRHWETGNTRFWSLEKGNKWSEHLYIWTRKSLKYVNHQSFAKWSKREKNESVTVHNKKENGIRCGGNMSPYLRGQKLNRSFITGHRARMKSEGSLFFEMVLNFNVRLVNVLLRSQIEQRSMTHE